MNENKFAFRILLLYLLVLMMINMLAALIPSSLDLLTADDAFLRNWSEYMAENVALGNIAVVICFLLPTVFAVLYALSALRAADIEVVKKRIVNAPTIFSVVGAAGWLVNYIAEFFVLLYARTFLDIQIGYILFVSGIFLILEGLISFELSYYVLESMSRFWILPKFFPDGGVAKTKGVISPSFSVMFVEFFVAVSVCPVVSLLYMLGVVIKNSGADLHINTLIVIAMFMLFAALVTFFFMKIFTVPLKKLLGMTERIKDGDFSARVQITSNDGLGILGDSFNEMTVSLQEKEFIRETFGKVVDPAVRDHILSGNVVLGGENCEITVMFCDIRNFTAMSEKMRPEEVVSFLNLYFTRMERCITKNHGIINKYIGDAVMALFGAPVKSDSHAEDAFRAALDMKSALAGLNEESARKNRAAVGFGIGLHSGDVLAGNIGAENRLEYTVIGDTVNTASRIESLCKTYHTDLLLSEATAKRIRSPELSQRLHFVDEAEIRGKTDKVLLFSW